MGYPDGYYYGQGRIICDTSTFSVGDTIRVRSMTDSSKVWNKQVATVGTALVFTVPCYDYYKICTVQTINDTPTEIGGVYRTVDYGQTLFIDVLDLHSLQGHQSILNAHNENYVLNIGDEVTIKVLNNGTPTDWVMQIGRINNDHSIDYVSKHLFGTSSTSTTYTSSALRTTMQTFYSNIDNKDKRFLKEVTRKCRGADMGIYTYDDYVWNLGIQEINGDNVGSGQTIFPIFTTQSDRIKTLNGTAYNWWTDDYSSGGNVVYISTSGTSGAWSAGGTPIGYAPCFTLKADS